MAFAVGSAVDPSEVGVCRLSFSQKTTICFFGF